MDYLFQFLKKFEQFSQKHELISNKDKIVIAVSGGLDSVVLLFCLQNFMKKLDLELVVAHLNHCLRGRDSDMDEKFVEELAFSFGLQFISEQIDIKTYAQDKKISIETAARDARYQFLEKIQNKVQYTKIATGHHADDQAETVLLNLFRGTGWTGFGGIPVKRGNIIRPLLFAYREELEKIVTLTNLNFRTDHSNNSLVFQRNKIRHELLPLIRKKFNPQVSKNLNEFAQIFEEGDQYLQEQAKNAVNRCLKLKYDDKIILEINCFSRYFTIIRKYVLFHLLRSVGLSRNDISFSRLAQIIRVIDEKKLGRFVPIAQSWQIGIDHSGIVLFREKKFEPILRKFKIGEEIQISELGLKIKSEIICANSVSFGSNSQTEYIDFEKLNGCECEVRSIQKGDAFFPLGLNYKQKFSDFFIDHKIPLIERQKALILTNSGKTVWLIAFRLDNRFRIENKTKKIVKFQTIYD